jgi:hypothetical protein
LSLRLISFIKILSLIESVSETFFLFLGGPEGLGRKTSENGLHESMTENEN